jgi:large subunit ribosomal protein L6
MSRIGKQPITLPTGVEASMKDGVFSVKGAKGTLAKTFRNDVSVKIDGNVITLTPGNTELAPALWGTYASHVMNMIEGVTKGYEKKLEIEGVGYRGEVKGTKLVLALGFSHPVEVEIQKGIKVTIEKGVFTIKGIDKDQLGQFAATVRGYRQPEPYKGKGIRYQGEYIIRKQGKKAV